MSKYYLYLFAAIAFEVAATTALARSASFTKLWPSVIAIAGYALAFWCLSFPLRSLPTGVVYAIWSGMGIVLITAVSWIWYRQSLDVPALIGISLILLGVVIVNTFSSSLTH